MEMGRGLEIHIQIGFTFHLRLSPVRMWQANSESKRMFFAWLVVVVIVPTIDVLPL